MTAPRLAPLEPPYADDVAENLAKLMPPGMPPIALFRTLAHSPRVLGRFRRGGLLDPGPVSLRDRELVILRTTALCRAEYEWSVHVAFFATAARLTAVQVAATVTGDLAPFAADEQALLRAVATLHETAALSDDRWRELAEGRTPAQLVELVTLAGQYRMISYLTNALGVPLEPGAPRFPA
jgi:alkylhydroperoxidase family enzyme